jgi:DNA-binding response OmpR family regulator
MYETIAVVEDDPLQLKQLEKLLTESGYYVLKAPDFEAARRVILDEKFDLLLLDLHLGEKNGMELLSVVKRMNDRFPVVILSSLTDIKEKVSAFEIGVDDYVTKPYHPAELLLRVKRFLKNPEEQEGRLRKLHSIGEVELDAANGILRKGTQQYFLRKKVLDLLLYLYNNRNQVVSKEQMIEKVWNTEFVDENVISVTIHEIRKYVERDPKTPRVLKTVKGLGYMLVG